MKSPAARYYLLLIVTSFGAGPTAWGAAPDKSAANPPAANGPLLEEPLATKPGAGWRVAKGAWKIVDGAWQGAELPADKHGAVARHDVAFTDATIEFDVRLDGATAVSLSINDSKGHNSRLLIRPTGFVLTKDDHDHAGPDRRVQLGQVDAPIAAGRWHHVRIEQRGPKFTAAVGDLSAAGEHEAIGMPKSNIGFTVAGQTAAFKNLRITPIR